jgi:hypothetical protein
MGKSARLCESATASNMPASRVGIVLSNPPNCLRTHATTASCLPAASFGIYLLNRGCCRGTGRPRSSSLWAQQLSGLRNFNFVGVRKPLS